MTSIPPRQQATTTNSQFHGPHFESWSLRFADPASHRALHLRFSLLLSRNGFRRLAEVCAISFQRLPGRETVKVALKQTMDLSEFKPLPNGGFKIGDCVFTSEGTSGSVQSKGQSIQWDLKMSPRQKASFDLIPAALRKAGIIRNMISSPEADLGINGTSTVNGEKLSWTDACGMLSHQSGPEAGSSSIWGHCNQFTNLTGNTPTPFVFEGISMRGQILGLVPSPRFSCFYFLYQGEQYRFNSLRDAVLLKIRTSLTDWEFHAERGDLIFRGHAVLDHKDFAGFSFEDTNGSVLYAADSRLSDLEIQIYRKGKLETALRADQTASIEIISRDKNPYIPVLI